MHHRPLPLHSLLKRPSTMYDPALGALLPSLYCRLGSVPLAAFVCATRALPMPGYDSHSKLSARTFRAEMSTVTYHSDAYTRQDIVVSHTACVPHFVLDDDLSYWHRYGDMPTMEGSY
ncbi:hypothetical protein T440DRAFT_253711 [Plenodomus tracheiphilus IPT5]|uniref:Uncharacterized protein n=1 Tax=Plenodomus tracheiphilus IPT5 TaxID=1408161 RepID=A0A6A7ARP7_9PLEO|nr:hypothetical protein T440DRAFT_253711 [Plenodomus tracheiphilus IPT5]